MRTPCTRCDMIVAALCVVVAVMTAGAVSQLGTEEAFRQTCSKNLSFFGKVWPIYANDYEDELPKAGLRKNQWVPTLPNWMARSRSEAYAIDPTGGTAKTTVTSSLYLLVKYVEAKAGWFVCPSERDTREFKLSDAREKVREGFELISAWDFGGRYDDRNNPSRHCSYSYHMPFDRYALIKANDAGMAVMADRNPWIDPNHVSHATLGWTQFTAALQSGDPNQIRIGNSDAHQRDGQNVLFMDGHVAFQTRPTCGVDGDNIYTIAPSKSQADASQEAPPRPYSSARPAHRRDSVLVQELPFTLHGSTTAD
jgi:prepilin-type processing-associated H-X9-DG protein